MNHQRYNDYYLVNDEDMVEDDIEFIRRKKCRPRKIVCISSIILLCLATIAFITVFIIFPLVFKNSLSLQQDLVFTRWNLVSNKTYYELFRFPGLKNHYVTVEDVDSQTSLKLGVWHMLPLDLTDTALNDKQFNYDAALKSSNYSVLLYFHGTGEDRSQNSRKYQLLRYFFHVIAFDYRGYGDSDKGEMFERNVVNDCVQVYKWLQNKTDSPIYVWGHSLGTALATSTLAQLGEEANVTGVILEAAFTNFREELYHHPLIRYFKWLPWFEATIAEPLTSNGFIFDTAHHILSVSSPIMFFHAMDDEIVPYFMSEKLYAIAQQRNVREVVKNDTELVLFCSNIGLNHYFIYLDPYVIFYIKDFVKRCSNDSETIFEGSHQS